MAQNTPLMEQYFNIKKDYPDTILFFRLGDFYEMFFDDAVVASRDLEIVLTARGNGEEKAPMCGIPYHAASGYVARLLAKGHKIAICEQMEDPKAVKGLVKREVVRIITPGTIVEGQLLEEKANNYLASITVVEGNFGLAYIDVSTGEFRVTQFPQNRQQLLTAELNRIRPAEIYFDPRQEECVTAISQRFQTLLTSGEERFFRRESGYKILQEHFKVQNLRSFGCEDKSAAIAAAGAILHYLQETQKEGLYHLRKLLAYEIGDFMALDPATRRNLELTKTLRGDNVGSLLNVIDLTVTSMGGRMIRSWLEQPLTRKQQIVIRQGAVANLVAQLELRGNLIEILKKTYDLQRILSRLSGNSANARDLLALRNTLQVLPEIKNILNDSSAEELINLRNRINSLEDLTNLLLAALLEEPPLTIKEGGMIRATFDEELEKFLSAGSQGKQWVTQLEQAERERTGIKSLKVGYNQVFGYYIEVTKSNLELVPDDYIRKQTLANCERFINQQLKDYEGLILNAHDKSMALEYRIFMEIREKVLAQIDTLQQNADVLAELDALCALAEVALRYHYVRPLLNETGEIKIIDGRHPVVEQVLPTNTFVPNTTVMDQKDNRTQIITGPNMAGKSTYMRQVALIVLLAHIGSYVPASSAEISIVDRIFTRVGASDDLATGQSTFMVEMNEVAYILNHATSASFIILDEIGRGTSTFDGMSIAWAVIEFINNVHRIGAKTLVATHYHELTELESKLDGVKNYHVAVECEGDEITFIRKIVSGCAAQSYGIQVAALAGLPEELTDRAKEILAALEKNETVVTVEALAPTTPKAPPTPIVSSPIPGEQLSLFSTVRNDIIEQLEKADLVSLTPLDALNLLYKWQQQMKRDSSGK